VPTPAASLRLSPSAPRVGAALAAFVLYAPVCVVLLPRMRGAGALVAAPVILAAWLLGWRGGLLASLLSIALNTVLYGGVGEVLRLGGAVGMVAMVPIGLMVGWLREMNARVRAEMVERSRVEHELAVADRLRLEAEAAANLNRASHLAAIGALATSLAHEINNPLAYVMSNLRSVDLYMGSPHPAPGDTEDARAAIREALEGLVRIQAIMTGIREISTGPDSVEQAVDVCAVLDAAVKVVQVRFAHRAVFSVYHRAAPYVLAHHGRLAQVFLNLLTNAAEAAPEEGDAARQRIQVGTRVRDQRVVIEISDSGSGIPPEAAERLFTPFFTTKRVGTGAGLGLYVSRNIVRAAGGDLTYTTEVGKGSTFRVELPAADQAQ